MLLLHPSFTLSGVRMSFLTPAFHLSSRWSFALPKDKIIRGSSQAMWLGYQKQSASWEAPHAYPFIFFSFLISNVRRATFSHSCVSCWLCMCRISPIYEDSRARDADVSSTRVSFIDAESEIPYPNLIGNIIFGIINKRPRYLLGLPLPWKHWGQCLSLVWGGESSIRLTCTFILAVYLRNPVFPQKLKKFKILSRKSTKKMRKHDKNYKNIINLTTCWLSCWVE